MRKEDYIKQLKQLIKQYHPDLCKDECLEKIYNEITIILNNKLNQIKTENNEGIYLSQNNFANRSNNQDYEYYKRGITYYKNIHSNRFYKTNNDKTMEPKTYEEQLKALNNIFVSFNCAEYYFKKVIIEYPKSEWADDAKDKIILLKKLHKSYDNLNIEDNTKIIDNNKFVQEMGLHII